MTKEQKDKFKVMEEEYLGMLLAQEEAYETEREQEMKNNTHNIWEMNGVSPWEL